jgi:hypothetical protein
MKRSEFLVVDDTRIAALKRCKQRIKDFVDGRKWKYLIEPEVLKYTGKSKVLQGKWRCYARIEHEAI